jgi:hypothetical protein
MPVIKIETGYSDSDHGQLKARIDTFMEMLNALKASKVSKASRAQMLTSISYLPRFPLRARQP